VSREEIEMAQDIEKHVREEEHRPCVSRAFVRTSVSRSVRKCLLTAFLLSSGALVTSGPAFAVFDGGAEHNDDWNGDHDSIYQVQRGDLICETREACGGAAAIPMNRPGYWYLPGGMFQGYHPVVPAQLPHPRH
jgi:hypothetical protein